MSAPFVDMEEQGCNLGNSEELHTRKLEQASETGEQCPKPVIVQGAFGEFSWIKWSL